MSICGDGEDEEARGVHVEAVDGGLRDGIGAELAKSVRNAVNFFWTASWYGEESAGFVDDDEVGVFVDKVEWSRRLHFY